MIISRTPLRLSFLGGGTDYPAWYNDHGGAVVATTIDKYCYVTLHNGKMWDTYDMPTKSGLATSSAFTVGLLRVCSNLDKVTLAAVATLWEQEKMSYNVGSQDQYLCAVGGFHLLHFDEHGLRDTPIEDGDWLQDYLLLFDTHQRRISGNIIADQLKQMKKHHQSYHRLVELAELGYDSIQSKDWQSFGELMNEGWAIKSELSPLISTDRIDTIYSSAIEAGAVGGKLLGGGGGGFILFVVEPEKHQNVRSTLERLTHVPFQFEYDGTEVIYDRPK